MFRDIKNMDNLVLALTGLNEIAILGNSPHINDLDFDKLSNMISIGVCRIGLKYSPDVLLWTENTDWRGRGDRETYRQILINTKSPVKICRKRPDALTIPECIQFDSVDSFGHEWKGGLRHAPSVATAIHLAMVAKVKNIYICGVDYINNEYFWGGTQFGSESGKYNQTDFRAALAYFEMIKKANKFCNIYMCSPNSRINIFKFSDHLNKERE